MTITMNDDRMISVAQIREFLNVQSGTQFDKADRDGAYEWISATMGRFRYTSARKRDRGVLRRYLCVMTGYSDAQIDRLIARKRETGTISARARTQPTFPRIYTPEDIALLAEVDNAESRRTGGAVQKTLSGMHLVYRDARFERLAGISVSHLYNLRGTRVYEGKALTYTKTQSVQISIGERRQPYPEGKPGFLRVDSVHQGDLDKEKGVYHINLVDEVTQDEIVVTVEGISELFLAPALEEALDAFPFRILNFHSDNGSEYINRVVAKLLMKLLVSQTKSRSRRTNDNALVEGKNASVIRKHFGRGHIPRRYAPLMQEFNRKHLNPYLFLHRQCAFADEVVDAKGKIKKVYKTYLTPCEKLLMIPEVERYLKSGVTRETLQTQILKQSHLSAAQEMQKAKEALFTQIHTPVVR